jgi:predicted membrane-bound mannosyltransferase
VVAAVSKAAINDVQKALNVIRSAVAEEDKDTQLATLALLNSTSDSIIQTARKMGDAQTKTKTTKVAIPQTKVVKQKATASNDTDDTERTRSNDDLSPTKPQPPLTLQQQREQ